MENKLETLQEILNFEKQTRTEQAAYFSQQLKKNVCVTNTKTWYIYDEGKKLFLQNNEMQYYTYFTVYMSSIVNKIKNIEDT